jgi:hypothetical protein
VHAQRVGASSKPHSKSSTQLRFRHFHVPLLTQSPLPASTHANTAVFRAFGTTAAKVRNRISFFKHKMADCKLHVHTFLHLPVTKQEASTTHVLFLLTPRANRCGTSDNQAPAGRTIEAHPLDDYFTVRGARVNRVIRYTNQRTTLIDLHSDWLCYHTM